MPAQSRSPSRNVRSADRLPETRLNARGAVPIPHGMARPMWKTIRPRSAPASRAGAAAFAVFCATLCVGVAKGAKVGRAPAAASTPPSSPTQSHEVAGDERPARAVAVLEVINGLVVLWKLQHGGRLPNFDAYPDWQQFLQSTDRAGWPSGEARPSEEHPIAPSLCRQPVNPLNGLSNVISVPGDVATGGRRAGFLMVVAGGEVFATDESGTRVWKRELH